MFSRFLFVNVVIKILTWALYDNCPKSLWLKTVTRTNDAKLVLPHSNRVVSKVIYVNSVQKGEAECSRKL